MPRGAGTEVVAVERLLEAVRERIVEHADEVERKVRFGEFVRGLLVLSTCRYCDRLIDSRIRNGIARSITRASQGGERRRLTYLPYALSAGTIVWHMLQST